MQLRGVRPHPPNAARAMPKAKGNHKGEDKDEWGRNGRKENAGGQQGNEERGASELFGDVIANAVAARRRMSTAAAEDTSPAEGDGVEQLWRSGGSSCQLCRRIQIGARARV